METLNQAVMQEQRMGIIDLHHWATLFAHAEWETSMHVLAARYAGDGHAQFYQKYAERFSQLESHIQRIRTGKPLVTATLLQQQGIPPGKRMGLLLKEAEKIAVNENWSASAPIIAKLSQHPLWHGEAPS